MVNSRVTVSERCTVKLKSIFPIIILALLSIQAEAQQFDQLLDRARKERAQGDVALALEALNGARRVLEKQLILASQLPQSPGAYSRGCPTQGCEHPLFGPVEVYKRVKSEEEIAVTVFLPPDRRQSGMVAACCDPGAQREAARAEAVQIGEHRGVISAHKDLMLYDIVLCIPLEGGDVVLSKGLPGDGTAEDAEGRVRKELISFAELFDLKEIEKALRARLN